MNNTGEPLKDTVIIYHGNCRDGFGAAYAAWKKFGDTASYLPVTDRKNPPEGLTEKDIFILDYSYDQPTLEHLAEANKSVKVIDHHISAKSAVEAFPQNIFDNDHSGAYLAWQYFHPDTAVPELLLQVEDHDLWKFEMPDNREFNTALGLYPMTFTAWDIMVKQLQSPEERAGFIVKGKFIAKFEDKLVRNILDYKERVIFEGHEVWAINAERTYRSILGNRLAGFNLQEDKTPIGIVYYRYGGAVHISLRSHGDTDVSAIAQKYGGGGHKNAASFRVQDFAELPFTFVE
ncbi:DHHA1 domain-containing protein [Candidatus Pacebacteria bacterium]|nr:DHHA1 domain-containing protein [Candidatus Paceibacterota bacterium]